MKLWELFKNHLAVALLFLFVGFTSGVLVYKHIADIFNAEVVVKGSYLFKTELDNYVTIFEFRELEKKYLEKSTKLELESTLNSELKLKLHDLQSGICQQLMNDVNKLVDKQATVEKEISQAFERYATSTTLIGYEKSETTIQLEQSRVPELRKYSEQLNSQIISAREKVSVCIN